MPHGRKCYPTALKGSLGVFFCYPQPRVSHPHASGQAQVLRGMGAAAMGMGGLILQRRLMDQRAAAGSAGLPMPLKARAALINGN